MTVRPMVEDLGLGEGRRMDEPTIDCEYCEATAIVEARSEVSIEFTWRLVYVRNLCERCSRTILPRWPDGAHDGERLVLMPL